MFSAKTYTARRHELRTKIGSGIILFPGNPLSPNNYPNNAYYCLLYTSPSPRDCS